MAIFKRPIQAFSQLYYSVQVQNRVEDKLLSLQWDDGKVLNYPYIYLRDDRLCPSCYNPPTKKHNSNFVDNDDKATIKSARIDQEKDELHIEWINDGLHTSSSYRLDWLKSHGLVSIAENQQYRMKRRLWETHLKDIIPRFEFDKVLNDKLQLYEWLQTILQNGAAIIDNVPKQVGQLQRVALQVSDLRHSFYG